MEVLDTARIRSSQARRRGAGRNEATYRPARSSMSILQKRVFKQAAASGPAALQDRQETLEGNAEVAARGCQPRRRGTGKKRERDALLLTTAGVVDLALDKAAGVGEAISLAGVRIVATGTGFNPG